MSEGAVVTTATAGMTIRSKRPKRGFCKHPTRGFCRPSRADRICPSRCLRDMPRSRAFRTPASPSQILAHRNPKGRPSYARAHRMRRPAVPKQKARSLAHAQGWRAAKGVRRSLVSRKLGRSAAPARFRPLSWLPMEPQAPPLETRAPPLETRRGAGLSG